MSDAMFNYRGFYARMAARPDFLRYVEVGVHDGASLCFLAERIKAADDGRDVNLYGIDLWDGEAAGAPVDDSTLVACKARLSAAGVREMVCLLRGDGVKGADAFSDRSVDFVFLDADHSYEHVRRAITAWLPKLRTGGVLAGHDILEDSCGVRQAVDEAFGRDDHQVGVWKGYAIEDGCWHTLCVG